MGAEQHLKAKVDSRYADDAFFASYSAEMLEKLEAAYCAVQLEVQDLEAWKALRTCAHKLKGSAPLYGHADLGVLAGETEIAILQETDQTIVFQSVDALIGKLRALDQADTHNEIAAKHTDAPEQFVDLAALHGAGHDRHDRAAAQTVAQAPAMSAPAVKAGENRRFNIVTAFQNNWMVGYLTRHFEDTANIKNLTTAGEVSSWAMSHQVDLFVFEHTQMGMDGFNLARQTALRNPMKNAPCLLAFYPGTSGRAVAEAVSLGGHTLIVDESKPRLLAERIEGLLTLKQRRVLLVDDDGPVQRILSDVFAGAGIHVDLARDGLEALDHLAAHKPDLVLLDSIMPRLNGEATLHEIQSRAGMQDIPVIVLTAETRAGSAARWFRRGAVDFITKPFDPEEVVARTLRYLEATP